MVGDDISTKFWMTLRHSVIIVQVVYLKVRTKKSSWPRRKPNKNDIANTRNPENVTRAELRCFRDLKEGILSSMVAYSTILNLEQGRVECNNQKCPLPRMQNSFVAPPYNSHTCSEKYPYLYVQTPRS
jgi:hypothetical protein